MANGRRILVAYYSRAGWNYSNGITVELEVGNTAVAAKAVAKMADADLFEIRTVKDYPVDYRECTAVAGAELKAGTLPELRESIDLTGYDTVILGYPCWYGTYPMAVKTFLVSHDFSGKAVLPFCTHEGSGMGKSESDLRRDIPLASIRSGLAIRGSSVANANADIREWLVAEAIL